MIAGIGDDRSWHLFHSLKCGMTLATASTGTLPMGYVILQVAI
jgi:hypothetical protein